MSKQAPFRLLNKIIEPGTSIHLNLEVVKLHTRTNVDVPIIVEHAHEAGPCILLLAGMHGDEVNGVEIVRRIVSKKLNKPQTGTVICIPVFNVLGFLNLSREFPDGRDLNRMFPGSHKGSLASRFAAKFMQEFIPIIDYVIDFHTGSAERYNFPQIRCNIEDEETLTLAKIFDAPFVVNSFEREKSMREALCNKGKKVLLFEGGKSKSFDKRAIEYGVHGAVNVMNHLGITNFDETKMPHLKQVFIGQSKWVRSPHSGMFSTVAKNGKFVNKGEILGYITDPYGDFEKKVKSSETGYVFCINTSPIVNKGDALFHVGTEYQKITDDFLENLPINSNA